MAEAQPRDGPTVRHDADARGWWSRYVDVIPPWFRAYVDLESAAALIRTYEGQLVPGLLQTEDYTLMVVDSAHLDESPEVVERRIALRMTRQTQLTRPGAPHLWAVVDEAALRRPVGSHAVMRAQLERLVEATKLPNVTLQILPFGAGAHPAIVGAFSIMRFPDQEPPDVVYLEQQTNALYLDKRDDVDQYLDIIESICARSTAPDRTAEFLGKILNEEQGVINRDPRIAHH